ncbi:demethylmenaquinone methyltransferase / 2-methoxy-6-polyprenyl-1,4-benzoquinol methylase [Thermoflexales bacterium]|nr:demethylmenaquinone methyltransferase / 2-methoxy-6-polyprenyl-1,4-benzoquinol methylase [Thermoflexales bacterium]
MKNILPRRLIKFGFQLLYHELAFTYDGVAWLVSLGQWRAWGRTALDRVCGPRVLEIGHGPGHLLIALARAGCRPIGIDLSPQMIRLARRNIRRAGVKAPQVQCRAEALPFRSGTFNSVVATFPTDYIGELATLCEVQRVTSDRGRLIVVFGAQLIGREPSKLLIEWLYRLTGQREAKFDEASIFDRVGMPARIETQTIGASTVTLIVAEKNPPEGSSSPGGEQSYG